MRRYRGAYNSLQHIDLMTRRRADSKHNRILLHKKTVYAFFSLKGVQCTHNVTHALYNNYVCILDTATNVMFVSRYNIDLMTSQLYNLYLIYSPSVVYIGYSLEGELESEGGMLIVAPTGYYVYSFKNSSQ